MDLVKWLQKKPGKLGLALSGGALHGAAHVGVLKVLEREGIFPSIIAGTSVGAIIGAAYSAGVSSEDISALFHKVSWPKLVKFSIHNTLSLFDTQPLESFIESKIGKFTFETLPRKFAVIACDLVSGERIVLDKGPVSPAIRASAAFPILLSPVKMNDRFYVDGGVVDNLPAGLVKEMGAEYIIGVDLSSPTKLCCTPNNFFEVAISVMNLMQARSALRDIKLIDCYIQPDVSDLSMWSFGDSVELEKRGMAAAELAIQGLKKDLRMSRV